MHYVLNKYCFKNNFFNKDIDKQLHISDNVLHFKKNIISPSSFCWFGYYIINTKKITVSFDIKINKKFTNKQHDIGLHFDFENNKSYINNFLYTESKNWESYEFNYRVNNNGYILFIFDLYNDFVDISIKNFNIRCDNYDLILNNILNTSINFTTFYTDSINDDCLDLRDSLYKLNTAYKYIFNDFKAYSYAELNNNSNTKKYVSRHNDIAIYNMNHNKIGFCKWKPYIILNEINKLNDNDIIVYRDVNVEKYENILVDTDDMRVIINFIMSKTDFYLSPELYPHIKLRTNCKKYTLEKLLNNNEQYLNKPLLNVSFIIIKKNQNTINILKEWLEKCQDYNLLSPNVSNDENPGFSHHTPEQSILNCILYKYYTNNEWPYVSFYNLNQPERLVSLKTLRTFCY